MRDKWKVKQELKFIQKSDNFFGHPKKIVDNFYEAKKIYFMN